MKIYHITAYDGDQGYLVFADSEDEAKKMVKKYYLDMNEESIGKLSVVESNKVVKGIFGSIDWTEPETPLFSV